MTKAWSVGLGAVHGAIACATALAFGCGSDEPRPDVGADADTDSMDSSAADSDAATDTSRDGDTRDGDDADALVVTWDRTRDPWPMFGGDPQRSGRSPFVGPTALPAGGVSWQYDALAGAAINMQPTVDERGIAFGTWGILRGAATTDAATSDKSDGRYHLLDREGHERAVPLEPARLPACYERDGASSTTDVQWCGDGLHVTYYNGTIEGTGLVDPAGSDRPVHYVGRGDGRLYAIDADTGDVRWAFATFDPTAPDHPDGGGEVVGGATMTPDGLVVFATFGLPWPGSAEQPARETQAVYAVDRDGALAWRYPPDRASLDNPVTAAVAVSPDGATVYAGTWLSDTSVPGRLLALDARTGALRWDLALTSSGHASRLWVRHLSVGADGKIYIAGSETRPFGLAAAVAAVVDRGDSGTLVWLAEPHGWGDAKTTVCQGLALGDGVVFASTGDPRDLDGKDALLAALDPATGDVLATFDPDDDAPGSMTGPIVDAAGHVYVGTRGRHDLIAAPWAAGSQWRRGVMHGLAWRPNDPGGPRFEPLWQAPVDGLLDWATPALDADGTLYFGSTAPLPFEALADIWKPLDGTPARTTPSLYAIAASAAPTPRAYRMGFQPWPYDLTQEAVDWTWDRITRDGDVYSIHLEEGVPWPEAAAGAPWSASYQATIDAKKAAIADGHAVLLSLNALDIDRAGLARYRGDAVNEPLPAPWDALDFDDARVKAAYTAYCERMIAFFDPDWLVFGIEVNILLRHHPERWPAYLDLVAHVRRELAATHPDLPMGVSVFANAFVDTYRDDADVPAAHLAALDDLRGHLDFLALSVYPFMSQHLCGAVTADYFATIFALGQGLPVAISESGHPGQRWQADVGGTTLTWDCTEAGQAEVVGRLLDAADAARAPFVIWFTVRDYDPLWEAIGRDPVALVWRDTGLFDEAGRARLAHDTWIERLARRLAPPSR